MGEKKYGQNWSELDAGGVSSVAITRTGSNCCLGYLSGQRVTTGQSSARFPHKEKRDREREMILELRKIREILVDTRDT